MCGIVGVFSDLMTSMEQGVFDKLLVLSSFRGEHSTGLIKAYEPQDKPNEVHLRKIRTLHPSPRFVYTPEYDKFMSSNYDTTTKKSDDIYGIIGHTRHATKGEVSVKNAHPFEFKDVIGVHNGTIKKTFKTSREYDTDSEAFYALLNDCGDITEALNEVQDFDSAYAFVWIDKRTNKICFVRNDKRPLYFTFSYQGRTMYMASTREMLEFVCKSKTIFNHERKYESPFFTLKPNHMMTIDIGDSPFESFEVTALDVKPAKSYSGVSYYGSTRNFSGGGSHGTTTSPHTTKSQPGKTQPTQTGSSQGSSVKSSGGSSASKGDSESLRRFAWLKRTTPASQGAKLVVAPPHEDPELFYQTIQGEQFVKGFEGRFYRESEIRHHLLNGCMSCGQVVNVHSPEYRKVVWYSRDTYICPDCVDLDWVQFMLEEERKTA